MKKFSVNCDFGGQTAPFTIFIGEPEETHSLIHFQSDWVSKTRGGNILSPIPEELARIQAIAVKYNLSVEALCIYTLGLHMTNVEEQAEAET